jgi:MYXO-CTERM domain-containing protein
MSALPMHGARSVGAVMAALLVVLTSSASARADALPPSDCDSSSIGEVCDTAGLAFNQPGTCVAEVCKRVAAGDSSVPPDAAMFACAVCELPPDAGVADAAASPDSSEGVDAGGQSGPSISTGCTTSRAATDSFGQWLGLAAVGAGVARRRRRA